MSTRRMPGARALAALLAAAALAVPATAQQPWVVRGGVVHTGEGPPLRDGVVVFSGSTIDYVGPAAGAPVPDGARVLEVAVVTPGLVDAHTTVGLAGQLNVPHDQDQLDPTEPIQPELRAVDAYNGHERLVEWVRSLGVTTMHTGHGPGAVVSGQTMVVKTWPPRLDEAVLDASAMVAATLGPGALTEADDKPPGTRAKAVAMLRAALVRAGEYRAGRAADDAAERPDRDLRLEALVALLERRMPLLVTAHRDVDIRAALRVAEEFDLSLVLDGAAEGYLLADEIAAAGVPVIVHPTMMRAGGLWDASETRNVSLENAARLAAAGVPIALQSGFEDYVPKTRVVVFEAALAAVNGLGREGALAAITIDAARLLGVDDRVGSLRAGKDADLALWDGDPFEYTTHCLGVFVGGERASDVVR